ncbi:MAG: Inositol 2-dehydrogenase [Planctomycetes bacterium ADurb.Bin126]|nr:MAG: Inositol 2-dehydrogenase [Planctomycetes bacterium ADurb.Bin126]HOD81032.1 Gfo/Idh/MocA family oxidoreductase [Phycisphaerae bacterium]HQL74534.1 Gfo/Idh/MocA family oxidoreductase [Phycisphaerae bacterium]
MTYKLTRRGLIKTSAAVAAGLKLGLAPAILRARGLNEKLNVACIGIGGQGGYSIGGVSQENIVALCDVDDQRAGKQYDKHPSAKKFYDFRKMFDAMEKEIDAVTVCTPDHTHFLPAMWALQRGKHLYCEKPMAHNVWEVRQMTELARKNKLATQLGVQRHTIKGMHRTVELIRSGAIGKVTEAYSWVSSTRGMKPDITKYPPVPDTLKWDLWIGPAPEHKYTPDLCPYNWRFWWNYGTGEGGNWGCHILDIPFWALDLQYPTRVDVSGPEAHPTKTPTQFASKFQFPARGDRGPVTLHWVQGTPAVLKEKGIKTKGNNLFIGTEGMLSCGFGEPTLLPADKFKDFKAPPQTIPDSPGFHKEWILAAKGDKTPPTCNFDYSGPLSETVLLANAAIRAGGGFDWDAANLKAGGNDKAGAFIREQYRKGWEI